MSRPLAPRRVAVLALAVSFLAGCGGGAETPGPGPGAKSQGRIVILTNGPDPYWDTCEAGTKAAEEALGLAEKGFEVDFQRGDFTDKGQLDRLDQYLLDDDVVALGISVYNPDNRNVADKLERLRGRGVQVITIDGDVNRDKFRSARFGYIGTDNVIGGRDLGIAAKALAPEGAKFAFFVGNAGAANAQERMAGFLQGAGPDFEEVARVEDGGDRPKARKNVEDVLDNHPDVNMLVGIWAYNTPQAVQVVRDRKLRDKTKIVCFDAAEASIREMGEGNVDVMVAQNPYQMGYEGIELLYAMVTDDQAKIDSMYPNHALEGERDLYRTDLRVIVPDEGSPITADLFDDGAKFFKLSGFREWLKERGLLSS